jgi:hypothetical protein
MGRSVRADNASTGLEVCWPDFGLTVTPNADNYCALLSNIPAGQRLKSLAMIVPVYIYGIRRLGVRVPPSAPTKPQVRVLPRGMARP